MVQLLRILLPMQGVWVRSLVWEDSTCHGATKSVHPNYWASVPGACALQQESEICSVMSSCLQLHGLIQSMEFSRPEHFLFSRVSSQPRVWTQVSLIAAEPPEKPKNPGMGSLSLLQWIFMTTGIKQGSPALQAGSLPTELTREATANKKLVHQN